MGSLIGNPMIFRARSLEAALAKMAELSSVLVTSAHGAQKIIFVASLVANFVESVLLRSTKLATKFGLRAEPVLESQPVGSEHRAHAREPAGMTKYPMTNE